MKDTAKSIGEYQINLHLCIKLLVSLQISGTMQTIIADLEGKYSR